MKKTGIVCLILTGLCLQGVFADKITLQNGDVIHGIMMEDREEEIIIQHDDLGEVTIPKDRVVSIEVLSATTAEATEAQKKDYFLKREYEFDRLNTFSAKAKEAGWKTSLNISINNSYGNTDEQAWRVGGNLRHNTERHRFTTDYTYYRKDKNSETTDNKYSQGLIYDWLLPNSKWFYFVGGRYDYDEFESWEHRVASQAGPGYRFIGDPFFTLDGRLGLGAKKEWGSEDDDVVVESLGGLDLSWQLSERQKFGANTTVYPVMDDIENFRTRSTLDWNFMLDRDMNLSFNIGLLHEYQSQVDPGNKRHDTRLFSGIQYDF